MAYLLIFLSVLYIASLAVIDGMFNRLIFRENRKLPYTSVKKQEIYKNWEWQVIGILFLLILPLVFPSILAFLIGGMKYVLGYWIIFLLIQWDIIFGKIVFDSWFGDTPNIALPYLGWIQVPLKKWLLIRLVVIIGIIWLMTLNIF